MTDNRPVTKVPSSQTSWLLADGHVHFYPFFRDDACLQWAQRNFKRAAADLRLTGSVDHVLFLAETAAEDWFAGRKEASASGPENYIPGYRCLETDESNSLCFENEASEKIFVIAGRQIVSQARLEVLALGLASPYPDGQPLKKIIADLGKAGCTAILPWGVGKWTGKRRGVIAGLLSERRNGAFQLGDSGNRPFFWPFPTFSGSVSGPRLLNLAGSDPLPLTGQERRIGSRGFLVAEAFDRQHPYQSFQRIIMSDSATIKSFGTQRGLFSFLRDQMALRLNRLTEHYRDH